MLEEVLDDAARDDDGDALERARALLCRDRVGERRDQILQPVCVMQANHWVSVGIDRPIDNLANAIERKYARESPFMRKLSSERKTRIGNQRIEPVTWIVVVPGGGVVSIARCAMTAPLPDGAN